MTGPTRVRLGGNLYRPVVPAGAVDITRRSPWGNPFRLRDYDGFEAEALAAALADHAAWLAGSADHPDVIRGKDRRWQRVHLAELAGLDLACWCRVGRACHGDVLLALANPETTQ